MNTEITLAFEGYDEENTPTFNVKEKYPDVHHGPHGVFYTKYQSETAVLIHHEPNKKDKDSGHNS